MCVFLPEEGTVYARRTGRESGLSGMNFRGIRRNLNHASRICKGRQSFWLNMQFVEFAVKR